MFTETASETETQTKAEMKKWYTIQRDKKLRRERWGVPRDSERQNDRDRGIRKQEREKETGRKESRKQTELQYDKDRWQER